MMGTRRSPHVGSTVEHGRSSRLDPQRLRALLRGPDRRTGKRAQRYSPLVGSADLAAAGQRPLAEASRRRVRTRPAHVRNRQPGLAPQSDHVGRAADHPRTAGTDWPSGPPGRPRPAGCRLPGQGRRCLCRHAALRVGGRFPAHCTAVGKALLAYSPQATVNEYLATGLRRRTLASLATRPPSGGDRRDPQRGIRHRTGRSRARGRVRRRPDPQLRRGRRRGLGLRAG